MFCSTSIGIHLLRGLGAAALLAAAFATDGMVLRASAVVGALVLMRGCPMCWAIGLWQTAARAGARLATGRSRGPA